MATQRRRDAIELHSLSSARSAHATSASIRDPSVASRDRIRSSYNPSVNSQGNAEEQSYPEPDQGSGAWMMLFACFIIQLPIWGFSLAFGIFQEYYTTEDPTIKGSKGSVPVIGAACNGVLYLSLPISFALLTKYPQFRPYSGAVGLTLTLAGYVASSFADQVWQLILTQGVLSAIGCGLLFSPTTLYLDEWFVRRKGLAIGIMWSSKSSVGVLMPFIARASLDRFGSRTTLRGWAVLVALTTLPILKFIKPRIPITPGSATRPRRQLLDVKFFRMKSFWVFQANVVVQGLGYFVPAQYLYSYATSTLKFSTFVATLITSAINASSVLGGIVLGMLCDRYPVSNVIMISSLGSAFSVLIFWGLSSPENSSSNASPYVLLTIFTIIYGFFAGGFSSTWSGISSHLKREAPGLESGFMFGILAGGRGLGNLISGPISAALLSRGPLTDIHPSHSGWLPGYGTQYGSVILFTGLTALLGTCSWLWQRSKSCLSR